MFFVIFFILLSKTENEPVLGNIMAEHKKCCEFCDDWFTPDPRVGSKQRACFKLICQQKRKKSSYDDCVRRNPDYFTGRYPNVKIWLDEHPGYLKENRQRRKNKLCDDIQNELTLLKSMSPSELRDIQNELTTCFVKYLPNGSNTRYFDIQNETIRYISIVYLVMIYKTRLRI